MSTIKLGSKVRDKVTGFSGTAIARTEWLSGCVRYVIQPYGCQKESGKPIESQSFDEQQIEVEEVALETAPVKPRGGPMPEPERGAEAR